MASRDTDDEAYSDEEYEEIYNEDEAAEHPSAHAAPRPAAPAQPAGLGAPLPPRGLAGPSLPPRGLAGGLPGRPAAAGTAAPSTSTSAAPQQQPSTSAGTAPPPAAAAPKGLAGLGLGAPKLPARPGGLTPLPPRQAATPAASTSGGASSSQGSPEPAAAPAAEASTSQQQPSLPPWRRQQEEQQPQQPAAPAAPSAQPVLPSRATPGAGPSLPARPAGLGPGAGLGPAAPRPAASAATTAPAAPSTSATSSSGAAAAAPQPAPAAPQAPPAPTPAPAPAPARPATPAAPPAQQAHARPASTPAPAPPAPQPQPQAAPAPARPAAPPAAARVPPPAAAPSPSTPSSALAAPAAPPAPTDAVVDDSEERGVRRLQRYVQDVRVTLIRAAARLGLRYESEAVQQFLGAILRLETSAGAGVYRGSRRVEALNRAAEREARELDGRQAADSRLDTLKVKVMLVGMAGTGKSELINCMLERPVARTSAFGDATRRVKVIRGMYHGIQMEFIDTPGLHASSSSTASNRSTLKAIRSAYNWHKPHYVLYVDRLDAARPSLGELSVLTLLNEALGAKVWRQVMMVLTHANAARASLGTDSDYVMFSRQRRNILAQLVQQAAGNNQVRNPQFLVDCHPGSPTNSFGQPVITGDSGQAVPWKQQLYMQLLGYRAYELVQEAFKEKAKGKGGAAAGRQPDMLRQMMRARLPPVSFYTEQLAEGVLKPDTYGAIDDPADVETEDEEAEEFAHTYYQITYDLAKQGNPWAQKEYAKMLRRMRRLRKTYRKAYRKEEVEMLANGLYEGYVVEGLDLGPTFDPDDNTNHRYCYALPDSDWQIMPTLDYYGFEHEDAITGFVADWEGQPFNRNGYGGLPLTAHFAVEKDKTSSCLQGEAQLSLVHAPQRGFVGRHITQINGGFEVLRPNIKDVLYQLEVNTFKDGLLGSKDHAGAGFMVTRLGEGGRLDRGPMGLGVRLQETMRLGAFKVEACAAKVMADNSNGGRDEAWGGRAFIRYDHLPGVSLLVDAYQQRAKDTDDFTIGGIGTTWAYDWEMLGAACGCEVDYVPGSGMLHLDVNLFSCHDYRLAWLLLLPAWNYAKAKVAEIKDWIRGGGDGDGGALMAGDGMEGGEEEDEEEYDDEEGEGGMGGLNPQALAALLQGQGGAGGAANQQALLQALMAQGGLRMRG